ncbi:MAG: GNAT family N-acetyltransferase [Tepidisphaeraceae bacterium]
MNNPSNPILAPATPADVPAILDFIRKLAQYERLSHTVTATEADLQKHLFGPTPAAEVILAKIDANPVGFALYFTTFSTFVGRPGIWLEDLFVLPEFRHRGIGRSLLRAVAATAVQRNCGRLEWSVLDWNQPAIQLYQKLGAVAMSDWTIQRLTGEALAQLASG